MKQPTGHQVTRRVLGLGNICAGDAGPAMPAVAPPGSEHRALAIEPRAPFRPAFRVRYSVAPHTRAELEALYQVDRPPICRTQATGHETLRPARPARRLLAARFSRTASPLLGVVGRVMLARLVGVLTRVQRVAVGEVRMVTTFGVLTTLEMFRRLTMMAGRMLVMLCGFLVVISALVCCHENLRKR